MNKQLYQSYKSLPDTKQAELRQRYKDSPIGLRLIEYLDKSTKPDFKTADAVAHIYTEDSAEEYRILENRFFKLRKKVLDELQELQADKSGANLPEEEAELNRCKDLISAGDKQLAYKLLTELEKTCWERNIFELLPSILDNMIFCNQVANDGEKNKNLYPLLEEAIELQYDLNRAIMCIRQVYEVTLSKGPSHIKDLLLFLKELGTKHSKYPRFTMYYHYVSLSYKLSSMDYTQNMQVISRHLAEFKKLYAKHTLIPMVIYKANHAKLFHYHFSQINAFIHNNKMEFEEAYQAMKEMWTLAYGPDTLFKTYRSDSLYFNLFTLQCMTYRYRDAYETCELYLAFLKKENRFERMNFANMMKAILYATAYPQTFKMDANYLLEQASEYVRAAKKSENAQIPLLQAIMFKAEIHLLLDDYKTAKKLLGDKEVQAYLTQFNSADLFNDLLHSLERGKGLEELLSKARQHKFKASKIDELIPVNWIVSYAERALKKLY